MATSTRGSHRSQARPGVPRYASHDTRASLLRMLEAIRARLSELDPSVELHLVYSIAQTLAQGWLLSLGPAKRRRGRQSNIEHFLLNDFFGNGVDPALVQDLADTIRKSPLMRRKGGRSPTPQGHKKVLLSMVEAERQQLISSAKRVTDKAAIERIVARRKAPSHRQAALVQKFVKQISQYRQDLGKPLRPRKSRKPAPK